MRASRRRVFRLLALLASLVPLALGELWLRAREDRVVVRVSRETTFGTWHPVLGWTARAGWRGRMTELMPGSEVPVLDYQVSIDSRGARGPLERLDPPGGRRVVAVGDSFTFGVGVDDDRTFCHRLEELTGAEVLNLGLPGYGIGQMHLRLALDGLPRRPHLVLMAIIGDDARRDGLAWSDNGNPRPRFELRGGRLLPPALPLPRPVAPGHEVPRPEGLRLLQRRRPDPWELGTALVLESQRIAREAGADFLLAYLPQHGEVVPVEWLAAWARGAGVPFVDLTPAFARARGPLFLDVDLHPNAAGHALIAEELAPIVARRIP